MEFRLTLIGLFKDKPLPPRLILGLSTPWKYDINFLNQAKIRLCYLCSCKFCGRNPSDICQVSPTGYSIVCSDWAQTHCP